MQEPTHILVVDDEPDVKLMFRHWFRKEVKAKQYKFHFAHSADEALSYLESAFSKFDSGRAEVALILSDINMPGMNGLELLRIIKEKYAELPVYMVTAYGDEKSEQTADRYGASGFISKPLDLDKLKQDVLSSV